MSARPLETAGDTRRRHAQLLAKASNGSRRRRVLGGRVMVAVGVVAIAAALFPLLDMLWLVAAHGIGAMSGTLFTQITNGVTGGLENAILGTLLLVAIGLALAAPLGVGTGIYLAEWSDRGVASVLRYLTDVLVGVPSIVIGYFGFVVFVTDFGWGFSALAGGIALAVMMLPYIARTTELALIKVPGDLREGSLALGITRGRTLHAVTLPVAGPSILTGVLLALGLGLGETAPLLYTASWSNYLPTLAMTHSPVGYLTYVVWAFIQEPFASSHRLAYAGALLLMLGVLLINIVARQVLGRRNALEG